MYLYVKKEEGLSKVPEDLLKLFGKPQQAMVLLLTPGKKLAHASVEKAIYSNRLLIRIAHGTTGFLAA